MRIKTKQYHLRLSDTLYIEIIKYARVNEMKIGEVITRALVNLLKIK